MEYTNSPLVVYTKLSPNYSKRSGKISKITIHHMAGNLSVEVCGNVFATTSRQASSNYGVGTDGRVGMYVEEKNRAWTSSNRENDNMAVTIEVANDQIGGNWHVSDKALAATIELCVDICKRNGIEKLNYTGDKNGNLTMHKWFSATACPGPYLESKFSYIAEEVNKRLGVTTDTTNKDLATEKQTLYRVRKSWKAADTQIGAFKVLQNAKNLVNRNEGYYVFDETGKVVYPGSIDNPIFTVGDKVSLLDGATYYNGTSIPNWVFKKTLYVRQINGDRIVISTLKSGAITGAVHKKYLK